MNSFHRSHSSILISWLGTSAAGHGWKRLQCLNLRLGFSGALQPTSDASIFLRGTIMPQNSGNCYERGNHYAILVSYIMTTVTLGAVFTMATWRAPHAAHASSICPRSLPPSQRWHLLKDQQQCEFGEAQLQKFVEMHDQRCKSKHKFSSTKMCHQILSILKLPQKPTSHQFSEQRCC